MKGVYIFLADGFEDIEALGTADVLLRGGADVSLVTINDDMLVSSSHGLMVHADMNFEMFKEEADFDSTCEQDIMIFPGGMPGTVNLAECTELMDMMREHWTNGGSLAAICAAPGLVLSQIDGIAGKAMTCFDGFESHLTERGANFIPKPAIRDGRIITGRSAGHAVAFGLEILAMLKGEAKAAEVRHALMLETI